MVGAKNRYGWISVLAVLAVGLATIVHAEDKKEQAAPKIQVALLLDTSNSMDGLIDQARTQLWKVVGEFTTIELGGKKPTLEVALYEYGNDGLPAAGGFCPPGRAVDRRPGQGFRGPVCAEDQRGPGVLWAHD